MFKFKSFLVAFTYIYDNVPVQYPNKKTSFSLKIRILYHGSIIKIWHFEKIYCTRYINTTILLLYLVQFIRLYGIYIFSIL